MISRGLNWLQATLSPALSFISAYYFGIPGGDTVLQGCLGAVYPGIDQVRFQSITDSET